MQESKNDSFIKDKIPNFPCNINQEKEGEVETLVQWHLDLSQSVDIMHARNDCGNLASIIDEIFGKFGPNKCPMHITSIEK